MRIRSPKASEFKCPGANDPLAIIASYVSILRNGNDLKQNVSRDNFIKKIEDPTVLDGSFVLPSQQRNVELFVELFLVGQRQHFFAGVDSVYVGVAART